MIQHVTRAIRSADMEDCITFYGILGFRPVEAPPGISGRAVWLEFGGDGPRSQVHLMPAEDARPETGHFAVVCRAYDATVDRLREAGRDVEARRRHWGSPRAFVRDPAGNLVELMAWPPGEQQE
jgi:catechol 2,3-dioxygenase-like lactoylglutathione lyase family enzyme